MPHELRYVNDIPFFSEYSKKAVAWFQKYSDMISDFAGLQEEEIKGMCRSFEEEEEGRMLVQWLKAEGGQEANIRLISRQLAKKFHCPSGEVADELKYFNPEDLSELGEYLLDCESFDDIQHWIQQRKQGESVVNAEQTG